MNGALPLWTIEIKVADESVLAIPRDVHGHSDATRSDSLALAEDRVERINLLSDLLHKAMDASRKDRLEEDLYLRLLKVLGQELFELLFQGQVRALVLENLRDARLRKLRLRMNLAFVKGRHVPWLAGLPWEYIHTPKGDDSLGEGGEFLSRETELMLSRRLEVKARVLGEDLLPIRVLLVCASPTAPGPRDDALPEVVPGAMKRALEELEGGGFVTLTTLVDENPPGPDEAVDGYTWQCTRKAFREHVKNVDPVLIHFMGHGQCLKDHGQLAFSHANGKVDWIDDDQFALDASEGHRLKAVFLQACESARTDPYVAFAGVAGRLAGRGIPAVVGMQYRVHADTAETFAQAFYSALSHDEPVDFAVKAGRDALTADQDVWDRLCFGLPVLYLSGYDAIAQRRSGFREKQLSVSPGGGARWNGSCPECGAPFQPGDEYCSKKGERLPPYCGNCGRIFTGELVNYCPECGEPTSAPYEDRGPAEHDDVLEELAPEAVHELERPRAVP